MTINRLFLLSAAAAVLAGCASQPTGTAGAPAGKHLVYRDANGSVVRQFDYPDDAFCRRVQALAGSSARCQNEPAAGLQAVATLRYNPPGILVQGHYASMQRCQADTAVMSAGVQLVEGCKAK